MGWGLIPWMQKRISENNASLQSPEEVPEEEEDSSGYFGDDLSGGFNQEQMTKDEEDEEDSPNYTGPQVDYTGATPGGTVDEENPMIDGPEGSTLINAMKSIFAGNDGEIDPVTKAYGDSKGGGSILAGTKEGPGIPTKDKTGSKVYSDQSNSLLRNARKLLQKNPDLRKKGALDKHVKNAQENAQRSAADIERRFELGEINRFERNRENRKLRRAVQKGGFSKDILGEHKQGAKGPTGKAMGMLKKLLEISAQGNAMGGYEGEDGGGGDEYYEEAPESFNQVLNLNSIYDPRSGNK
tara:strand:- start:6591 stop:7481 length:891 start_codon:yes stop_codon:yes gene_type:complete